MVKYCGKTIGGAIGYSRKCGGLWMGKISQCEKCRLKEIRSETIKLQHENAKLQNILLKKQLSISK